MKRAEQIVGNNYNVLFTDCRRALRDHCQTLLYSVILSMHGLGVRIIMNHEKSNRPARRAGLIIQIKHPVRRGCHGLAHLAERMEHIESKKLKVIFPSSNKLYLRTESVLFCASVVYHIHLVSLPKLPSFYIEMNIKLTCYRFAAQDLRTLLFILPAPSPRYQPACRPTYLPYLGRSSSSTIIHIEHLFTCFILLYSTLVLSLLPLTST